MKGSLIFCKRRAVSEVISTVLILAITMVGAVFVASIIQDTVLTGTDQTSKTDAYPSSLRLTAYDTRDSSTLSQIANLNNTFTQSLCTKSCNANPSFIPNFGGTEFVVIQLRNNNIDSIFLQSISINGREHFWDEKTPLKILDASSNDNSGKYPSNGKFSIIPISNEVPLIQKDSVEINGGDEVRIIVKLSENLSDDIPMWEPVQIYVNFGGPEPSEFVILSGDTK